MLTTSKLQEVNSLSSYAQNTMDLDWLSCQPMLPFLVPAIPAQLLYSSLMARGLEDSVEIIEWIRGPQLQKLLDFDIWEKSSELQIEDVNSGQFLNWVRVWIEIGQNFAAERFFELEEETITLILSKLFEIVPVGVNQTSDDICENWWQTADKRFYLKLRIQDEDTFYLAKALVDALYATDIQFAGSAFSYASMLVRQESLETGLRWRANRLSDQGFVPKEEALEILAPKRMGDLKKIGLSSSVQLQDDSTEAYDQIVFMLSKMLPEEGIGFAQLALTQETINQIAGESSTPLEHFYDDADFISEVAEKIVQQSKSLLLRSQISRSGNASPTLLIEKVFASFAEQDHGKLNSLKERVAHISNVIVSATANSFNIHVLNKALSVTKGALNIGLEICFAQPQEYHLNLDETKNNVENAVGFIELLGPEFVFHLGWNALLNLSKQLPQKNQYEYGQVSNEFFVTLSALSNFIPMFPKTLECKSTDDTAYVPQETRPFETLADIENAKLFIKNLQNNIMV